MQVRPLAISGAIEFTPVQHDDPRGTFLEAYKEKVFTDAVGHSLHLAQVNCSVSSAGVVRGIHFAAVPPGQAKYVFCPQGAALDVIIDIRLGSPTFGQYDTVLIDDETRRTVYLAEGLGHAFIALEDNTVITYLCSTGYNPGREHGVHPLDETLAIEWPTKDRQGQPLTPLFSEKDQAAPTLKEAEKAGLLPEYEAVEKYIATL